MKVFDWNDCNVCINPNIHIFDTNRHFIRIHTAFDSGKWLSGHEVYYKPGAKFFGSFYPVSRNSLDVFESEKMAIIHELRRFLKWRDFPQKDKEEIKSKIFDLSQLTLF